MTEAGWNGVGVNFRQKAGMKPKFYKVIACEIALREICHVASLSRNLIDPEFLTQGLHDTPSTGLQVIQRKILNVPQGKYDAILVGYGLCGNLIRGLTSIHTPLVIPRAHDCITLFLGSKERYADLNDSSPGTYFYTSGWLECLQRRNLKGEPDNVMVIPTRAGASQDIESLHEQWVAKFGEERAKYLLEEMKGWAQHYTHGALIDFPFTKALRLEERVQEICARRGWEYLELQGDLGLLQRWVDGIWNPEEFLILNPGDQLEPSYNSRVIEIRPTV